MTDNDTSTEDDFEDFDVGKEYPTLMMVARFASLIKSTNWFHHIGEALNAGTIKTARSYLDALGFPEGYPAEVPDWQDAISCLETNDWNSPSWEAEEQLAASLITDTLEFIEEDVLEVALTNITSQASDHITNAVEEASIRWGVDDEELLRAAIGQAVQTCYQAALVIASGEEDEHPFALKFKLYESGHWPLGIAGNTLNIF
ncbi:MAG: hypothetical protein HOJ34_04540 [Kordiimonadaceae bacterium]|jgi:hypothetical protein|nr:hypothetical protein [Kordiimonadaceae bacterium]MBT6036192.1 hypothetical protein [Kordiimonadaceae bacterium]MBT6329031.1 hypothetical protein [Kordiimonadaceae bacterium]MBT7581971.1 hypothetical protein [Kordiimonadaceae bacterium]